MSVDKMDRKGIHNQPKWNQVDPKRTQVKPKGSFLVGFGTRPVPFGSAMVSLGPFFVGVTSHDSLIALSIFMKLDTRGDRATICSLLSGVSGNRIPGVTSQE